MTELCSASSRARAEPLAATASRVARWLLVEHRGAWGPQSVPSSRMPKEVARRLAEVAAADGARLLLVRRPAGVPCQDGRWVFSVNSRPGQERVLARHVETDAELLEVAPGDPAGWSELDGELYLVCTHGRKDRCCALRGRPVAQSLAARHPDRTWESSHVGGDRFSANVIVLPDGLYLGQVEAGAAVRMITELAAGRLPPGHVRGRSSLPLPTQAAQHFAREALGRWGTRDLAPVAQEAAGPDAWRVRLAGPEVEAPDVEVVVRYDRGAQREHQLLTCGADQVKPVPLFAQVSLTEL